MGKSKAREETGKGIQSIKDTFVALRKKLDSEGTLSEENYHDFFDDSFIKFLNSEDIFQAFKSDLVFCKYILRKEKEKIAKKSNRKYIFEMLRQHPKAYSFWANAIENILQEDLKKEEEEEVIEILSALKIDKIDEINEDVLSIFTAFCYHDHNYGGREVSPTINVDKESISTPIKIDALIDKMCRYL